MNPTLKITVLLVERFEKAKEWKLEIPADPQSPNEIADTVFELSNKPSEWHTAEETEILRRFPRTGLRSVSIGDVLLIEDPESTDPGKFHVCTVESAGFRFHTP